MPTCREADARMPAEAICLQSRQTDIQLPPTPHDKHVPEYNMSIDIDGVLGGNVYIKGG